VRERPSLQLVLTGCPFDLLEKLKPLLQEPAMKRSVRHLGYVGRDEVVGLYGAARMLVFPSRFEGFGLPLLEAMHLVVPVACSNIGSLPEVGGDAVIYFDPLDGWQIAEAILTVTGDGGVRQRLIAAGNEQQLRFNYARTAEETLAVFRKVGSGELLPPGEAPFRPLAPGRLLDQGVGRWFFRLDGVRRLRVQVLPRRQPAA